ncbi:MAG: GNAT family N-acetyltransferase [Proteobacteria bacterium]|nr:GNAT family N-acetyltransferase [Pseudomonadota bacterium]
MASTTITLETNHLNPQLLVSHPPEFTWQDADSATISACYELLSLNVSPGQAETIIPKEQFEQLALHLQLKPRILFSNERPIAFVWVVLENSTGQLLFMARHPDFRAKGLGKMCLGEANRVLQKIGYKKLQAEVRDTDTSALKLFETCGFRVIRKLSRFQLKLY